MAPERLDAAATRGPGFLLLVWIFSLLAACSTGPASTVPAAAPAGGTAASPFKGLLALYRGPLDHLSAVRRGECPMVPSCSEYALQATAKHGELLGWIMASDRLQRCGRDERHLAPRIRVNGEWRYHDPVDRNDFWWSATDAGRPAADGANPLR